MTAFLRARPLVRFAIGAGLALSVLLVPWPGFGRAFALGYTSAIEPLIGVLLPAGASVRLAPEGPFDSWNALVRVENAGGQFQVLSWELRRSPFLPLAVFVSAWLGFPFAGARASRAWVLGLGLVALQIPFLLRFLLLLASPELAVFEFSTLAHAALRTACTALVFPPAMAFAVPALIFFALIARFERTALVSLFTTPVNVPAPEAESRYVPRVWCPSRRPRRRARARPNSRHEART